MTNTGQNKQKMLIDALNHLQSAIELLDDAAAPAHIAAHVDLAVNQLEGHIWAGGGRGGGRAETDAAGLGAVNPF